MSAQPSRLAVLRARQRRRFARLVERRPLRVGPERPMLSVSFDDVPVSAAVAGAALLEDRGARGTFYVSAGLAGEEGEMGRFAGADDVRRLVAAGHEIACHTYSHMNCGEKSGAALEAELDRNGAALADWGAQPPTTFAYPYGEVAWPSKRVAARRFALARSVRPGLLRSGADVAQAPAVGLEGPDGEQTALRWLEQAASERAWLILYTHDVSASPSRWGTTPDALARVLDAALASGFEFTTVAEGARRLGARACG